MDSKLLKAILSMDSYNRGYNSGIDLNVYNENGVLTYESDQPNVNEVGDYKVIANSSLAFDDDDQSIGFYGIAYQHVETDPQSPNYQDTIISYRGTDDEVTATQVLTGVGDDPPPIIRSIFSVRSCYKMINRDESVAQNFAQSYGKRNFDVLNQYIILRSFSLIT